MRESSTMKRKELRELDRAFSAASPTEDKFYDYEYEENKRRLKKERLQRRRIRREEEYTPKEDI